MKVFISWSGQRSRKLGEELRNWLPKVLQASSPWMSDEDINTGARWAGAIAKELSGSSFGVICVTPENMHNPWLLFEAGALSKTLEDVFVCPLLLDFSPADLDGPLSQFQAVISNRDGVYKLLSTLNKAMPNTLSEADLADIFDVWWPRLEQKIKNIPALSGAPIPSRSSEDVLIEILEISREHLRRDNLRIEHQKERDKQLDGLLSVMDKMATEAHNAMDNSSGSLAKLASMSGLSALGIQKQAGMQISPEEIAQMTKVAEVIAQGIKSSQQVNPKEFVASFKSIATQIDEHDQLLYANLLETPKVRLSQQGASEAQQSSSAPDNVTSIE